MLVAPPYFYYAIYCTVRHTARHKLGLFPALSSCSLLSIFALYLCSLSPSDLCDNFPRTDLVTTDLMVKQ